MAGNTEAESEGVKREEARVWQEGKKQGLEGKGEAGVGRRQKQGVEGGGEASGRVEGQTQESGWRGRSKVVAGGEERRRACNIKSVNDKCIGKCI